MSTTTALAPLENAIPERNRIPGATMAEQIAPFLGWFLAIRGRSPNTISSYGRDLRRFVAFAESGGITLPSQVTFNILEMYFAHRQQREGCKPTTVNRSRHALGSFFKFLRRQGLCTHDPVADTYGFKKQQRVPKYLTIAEQGRLLDALAARTSLSGRRDYAMVATALFCGLRVSELASARVTDLDLEAGTLTVVGKGDKQRECPIVPKLQVILRGYLARTRPKLVGGRAGSPYLFLRVDTNVGLARTKLHEPLLTRAIWWILARQVSPILGKRVHPHMLRHSFASRLREHDAPIELVKEALGHADITTTMIYAHISTAKRKTDIARYLEAGG